MKGLKIKGLKMKNPSLTSIYPLVLEFPYIGNYLVLIWYSYSKGQNALLGKNLESIRRMWELVLKREKGDCQLKEFYRASLLLPDTILQKYWASKCHKIALLNFTYWLETLVASYISLHKSLPSSPFIKPCSCSNEDYCEICHGRRFTISKDFFRSIFWEKRDLWLEANPSSLHKAPIKKDPEFRIHYPLSVAFLESGDHQIGFGICQITKPSEIQGFSKIAFLGHLTAEEIPLCLSAFQTEKEAIRKTENERRKLLYQENYRKLEQRNIGYLQKVLES